MSRLLKVDTWPPELELLPSCVALSLTHSHITSYYCCITSCLHDALYRQDELAVAAGGVPAVLHGDVPRAVREEGAVVVAAVAGTVHVLGGQHRGALHLQQIQGRVTFIWIMCSCIEMRLFCPR